MSETEQRGKDTISQREILWASVALTSLLVTLATILTLFGKDVESLLRIAQIFALPLISCLGFLLYREVKEVKAQVNGRMTQLIDNSHNSIPIRPTEETKE
jgi:bacteriorhodopsin